MQFPKIDDLIAKVREIAAEQPDFVYEAPPERIICSYIHADGQPGCVFGQALMRLGVTAEQLDAFDHRSDVSIESVISDNSPVIGIKDFSTKMGWCARVQRLQDSKATWARALADADAEYPLG